MKAIEQLRNQLTSMGASLDDGDYSLHCDAPRGYVWAASGMATLSIHYASNHQRWLVKALRDEMPALRMGLRLADEDKRAEIEHNNDDGPWITEEGAALTITFPA